MSGQLDGIERAKVATRSVRPGHSPNYIWHPSFKKKSAAEEFDPQGAPSLENEQAVGHLPDEETKDLIRRMHYAAYRADTSTPARRQAWKQTYFRLRDRVVLGNRKLVFRAIHKSPLAQQMADDLIGECDIIMIHAVAAFNPWLGIRFSTYAFTCLLRGLARVSRRVAAKRIISFLPLDSEGVEAVQDSAAATAADELRGIAEFLRPGNVVLTSREKAVISKRFGFNTGERRATLESLGDDMGISKERVRQVQASALAKLRSVLLTDA